MIVKYVILSNYYVLSTIVRIFNAVKNILKEN